MDQHLIRINLNPEPQGRTEQLKTLQDQEFEATGKNNVRGTLLHTTICTWMKVKVKVQVLSVIKRKCRRTGTSPLRMNAEGSKQIRDILTFS